MVNCLGFNDPSIPVKTICNPCIKKLYTCQSKFYGIILYVYYDKDDLSVKSYKTLSWKQNYTTLRNLIKSGGYGTVYTANIK